MASSTEMLKDLASTTSGTMNGTSINGEVLPEDPTARHLLTLSHDLFATVNIRPKAPPPSHSSSSHHQHCNLHRQDADSDTSSSTQSLQPHLAPTMSVEHADSPIYSHTNLLDHFQGLVRAHPDFHVEVLNSSAWFYEGCATVWCWLDVTGLGATEDDFVGGGLAGRREAVAVLFWERVGRVDGEGGGDGEHGKEGTWVCTRHKAFRSVFGI